MHIHDKIDFVVTACIVHKDKVLVIHHRELGKWVFVGGHVELDEDTDQALMREINEETGLGADDLEFVDNRPGFVQGGAKPLLTPQYTDIHDINKNHRHVGLMYFVKSNTGKVTLAENEHHEIKWVTADGLDDMDTYETVRYYARQALKMLGTR